MDLAKMQSGVANRQHLVRSAGWSRYRIGTGRISPELVRHPDADRLSDHRSDLQGSDFELTGSGCISRSALDVLDCLACALRMLFGLCKRRAAVPAPNILMPALVLSSCMVPCIAVSNTANEPSAASGTPRRILQVGPGRLLISVAAAAAIVRDGDTIEIDAGEYRGDVAVWSHERLVIRAVGGRARLVAAGASAENKAIWVVRSKHLVVENIDFIGARVSDRNGAGIRFERGHMVVRNCAFLDNENGILTGNDAQTELDIEGSEFGGNGHGDGYSHNLYVGTIARLMVTSSHFHHARVGHLLKSRAAESRILFNRLTDEIGGTASYELEFPSGGVAHVFGNIIQQGELTSNPAMVSFGAEGYHWPRNELHLINNTLIDKRPRGGVFLAVNPGRRQLVAVNNLLLGAGSLEVAGEGEYRNNFRARADDFVDPDRFDYRLRASSRLFGRAERLSQVQSERHLPVREYLHPLRTQTVKSASGLQPGAMQSTGPGP